MREAGMVSLSGSPRVRRFLLCGKCGVAGGRDPARVYFGWRVPLGNAWPGGFVFLGDKVG